MFLFKTGECKVNNKIKITKVLKNSDEYTEEGLLVKVKALEMVLKEQQEKLLNNDKGFQRTI